MAPPGNRPGSLSSRLHLAAGRRLYVIAEVSRPRAAGLDLNDRGIVSVSGIMIEKFGGESERMDGGGWRIESDGMRLKLIGLECDR